MDDSADDVQASSSNERRRSQRTSRASTRYSSDIWVDAPPRTHSSPAKAGLPAKIRKTAAQAKRPRSASPKPVLPSSPAEPEPVLHPLLAASAPAMTTICGARWDTPEYLPPEFRHRWHGVLERCLRAFARSPSLLNLRLLFLASKALLAAPPRGGKARAEAVCRMLRERFEL
jgi:hypothetical protein